MAKKISNYIKIFAAIIYCILWFSGCAYKDFRDAQTLENEKKYKAAAKQYYQSLMKNDKYDKARLGLADSLFSLCIVNLRDNIISIKDWENAVIALEVAVEIEDINQDIRKDNLVQCYNILGSKYIESGDYKKAIEYFDQGLEIDTNSPDIFFNLSYCYGEMGDLDKELDTLKKVIELDNKFYEAYNNIGIIYNKTGLYEKAIENLSKIPDSSNYAIEAGFNLTESLTALKEYDKAIEKMEKLEKNIKESEDKFEFYNKLGSLYFMKKEYNKALYYFKKAIEFNFWNVDIRSNIANVYYMLGEYDTAVMEYKASIELNESDYDLYLNLAKCYIEKSMYYDAIKVLNTCLVKNENYTPAYYVMGKLYQNFFKDREKASYYYTKYVYLNGKNKEEIEQILNSF